MNVKTQMWYEFEAFQDSLKTGREGSAPRGNGRVVRENAASGNRLNSNLRGNPANAQARRDLRGGVTHPGGNLTANEK